MVKKTLFKYGSVLMSVVLIASTLTACGTNTAYNQTQSEVAISSEAASNTESLPEDIILILPSLSQRAVFLRKI